MGCSTCNGKTKNDISYEEAEGKEIKLIPDAIADGNFHQMGFLLKLLTTVVITAIIPLVIVVIVIQFILHMFTPGWLQKIQMRWSLYWKRKLRQNTEKRVVRKNNATKKKREKQFEKMKLSYLNDLNYRKHLLLLALY